MIEQASEATRLEGLWSGGFGDAYVERNSAAATGRAPFWRALLDKYPVRSALEVGCNVGGNLEWVAERIGATSSYGVDINVKALHALRARIPGIGCLWSPARDLPFRDARFDLVFTMGVLIHQPPEALPIVMSEIVRTSRKYVLCGEYYAAEPVEVPYRGETGALFKRDFGGDYQRLFPELRLVEQGFLAKGPESSWDDVTWWLFEKP